MNLICVRYFDDMYVVIPLVMSCDVDYMALLGKLHRKQKKITGIGHYVNRLVPKNDIKLI